MSLRMSEEDKNSMLNILKPEGESYKAMLWGTIMGSSKDISEAAIIGTGVAQLLGNALGGAAAGALGALSNQYSYIGLTNTQIVFCVVDNFNASKVKTAFSIPLTEIESVQKKFNIIPARTVLMIHLKNGSKMKLALMNNAIGTNIKNQKGNVQIVVNTLLSNYN